MSNKFMPHTEADIRVMLDKIGVENDCGSTSIWVMPMCLRR